jgi:hypothetical protein
VIERHIDGDQPSPCRARSGSSVGPTGGVIERSDYRPGSRSKARTRSRARPRVVSRPSCRHRHLPSRLRLGSVDRRDDVAVIFTPNCPEYPAVFQGVLSVGAVCSMANALYTSAELAHQLRDSGACGTRGRRDRGRGLLGRWAPRGPAALAPDVDERRSVQFADGTSRSPST